MISPDDVGVVGLRLHCLDLVLGSLLEKRGEAMDGNADLEFTDKYIIDQLR